MAVKRLVAAFVLDRSGSMDCLQTEAIDFFNKQLETLRAGTALPEKEVEGDRKIHLATDKPELETVVCLVPFSSRVDDPIHWLAPLAEVDALTTETYVPNGNTALNDAVGSTLERLEAEVGEDDETAVLMFIVTDGAENFSKRFNGAGGAKELNQWMEKCKKTGRWTVVFLGSNQDLVETASSMGMSRGNAYLAAGPAGPECPAGWTSRTIETQARTASFVESLTSGAHTGGIDEFYGDALHSFPPDEYEPDTTDEVADTE